jgi:hypothetical protein
MAAGFAGSERRRFQADAIRGARRHEAPGVRGASRQRRSSSPAVTWFPGDFMRSVAPSPPRSLAANDDGPKHDPSSFNPGDRSQRSPAANAVTAGCAGAGMPDRSGSQHSLLPNAGPGARAWPGAEPADRPTGPTSFGRRRTCGIRPRIGPRRVDGTPVAQRSRLGAPESSTDRRPSRPRDRPRRPPTSPDPPRRSAAPWSTAVHALHTLTTVMTE